MDVYFIVTYFSQHLDYMFSKGAVEIIWYWAILKQMVTYWKEDYVGKI